MGNSRPFTAVDFSPSRKLRQEWTSQVRGRSLAASFLVVVTAHKGLASLGIQG